MALRKISTPSDPKTITPKRAQVQPDHKPLTKREHALIVRRLKIYIAALDQTIAAMREYGDSIDSGKASLRRLKIVERLTYKVIEMEKGLAAMAESYYPNAPWVMCRAPWQKQAEAFLAIDKATPDASEVA